jgi:pyridoxine 4-dehydrogenase
MKKNIHSCQSLEKHTWSKLGLGTGTLASLGRASSLKDLGCLLSSMLDNGSDLIDTADTYGSGDCEILLGKALKGKRCSFRIVTKAGYCLSNMKGPLRPLNQFIKKGMHRLGRSRDFSATYLSKCIDNSLLRLKTDRLDCFLLHDAPMDVVENPRIHELMLNLKKSGKTILTGISCDNADIIRSAIKAKVYDVIQTPANLIAASYLRDVWNECEQQGIRIIGNHVFSPEIMGLPGMSHEQVMKACSALLPGNASILCGTKNPLHFINSLEWAKSPSCLDAATKLALECLNMINRQKSAS